MGTPTFTNLDWPDYAQAVKGSALSVEDFERHVSVIQFVLNRWNAEKLNIRQVTADLHKLDLKPAGLRRVVDLFASLEDVGKRVFMDSIRNFYETVALPTIDDMNAICELRPLFGDPAYEARPMGNDYDKLLGFTEVILLEIAGSNAHGEEFHSTYQMSEREFDHLIEGLMRARQQFEAMKKWKESVGETKSKRRAVRS